MRITIEQNELIYLYLLDREKSFGMIEHTLSYVDGKLIYDKLNNWIGITINRNCISEHFNKLKVIDELAPQGDIVITENCIEIKFITKNDMTDVKYLTNALINIDIIGNFIYGIEIIMPEGKKIKQSIDNRMVIE